jgi:hypothetical protein
MLDHSALVRLSTILDGFTQLMNMIRVDERCQLGTSFHHPIVKQIETKLETPEASSNANNQLLVS